MDVQDKVVLITGASAGIGRATARKFAAAGAKVALVARSTDKLVQLAEELQAQGHKALAVTTDMRNSEEVARMVDTVTRHFGRLDILVNNAAQAAAGTIAGMSVADYRQIIELNMLGPVYAMQAAIPSMKQNGGGLIINISSMVSKMHILGLAAYASTKAALNVLSETARGELAPDNIRVITVFPRITSTDLMNNSLGNREMRRQQRAARPDIPVDTPEHVAEKIVEAAQREPAEQYMEEDVSR